MIISEPMRLKEAFVLHRHWGVVWLKFDYLEMRTKLWFYLFILNFNSGFPDSLFTSLLFCWCTFILIVIQLFQDDRQILSFKLQSFYSIFFRKTLFYLSKRQTTTLQIKLVKWQMTIFSIYTSYISPQTIEHWKRKYIIYEEFSKHRWMVPS